MSTSLYASILGFQSKFLGHQQIVELLGAGLVSSEALPARINARGKFLHRVFELGNREKRLEAFRVRIIVEVSATWVA